MLELLTKPSSRGSGRTTELERSLFINWHSTKPSRRASVNSRRSRSSPLALSPLDDNAPTLDGLLELPFAPLLPHIRSSRDKARMRTSTSSQSLAPTSVRVACTGGLLTSLHSNVVADLISSRNAGSDEGDVNEALEILKCLF